MPAKETLLAGLNAISLAMEVEHLVDRGPDQFEHNTKARLLRNGLCVVAFTTLEDFLKSRMAELIAKVGTGPVVFSRLPKRLRKLGTVDVLDGLRTQARRMLSEGLDALPLVQEHASFIASTLHAPYTLSFMGFGREASNLNANAIKVLLGDFQIKDGWGKIGGIASRVGMGLPSAEMSFLNASRSRHSAAHDINANIQIEKLRTIAQDALTVAIGFDLTLSAAIQLILHGDRKYLAEDFEFTDRSVRIRFIDQIRDAKWSCRAEGATKAWRSGADLAGLVAQAKVIAERKREFIVVRNMRSQPVDWYGV